MNSPVPFSVTKHTVNDGVIRLAIDGEIDMSTVDALAAVIRNTLTIDRPAELIIDLDAVTFLDSTGIAALVEGRRHAADHGTMYLISNPHGMVHHVLHVTGTLKALTGEDCGPA